MSLFSRAVFFLLSLTFLISCSPASTPPPKTDTYLFLGHPYDWRAENRIDPRLELLDYSQFKGVWLGGDVCARSSKSPATLSYLDSIFRLADSNTHWTWGNHDIMEGDERLISQATQRPDYYTHYDQGLLLIILNTNLFWHHPWSPPQEDCERKAQHYAWFHSVLDTIETASHVVVLHHHGLLNELKTSSTGDTLSLGNMDAIPVRPLCAGKRSFTTAVYPKLRTLRAKGKSVLMISGDVGMRSKGYHFSTPEGIQLLGSGINNSLDMNYPPAYVTNFEPDSVLTIQFTPQKQELDWSFVRLSDLVRTQIPSEKWGDLNDRVRKLLLEY